MKGTILLAPEGINASISGERIAVDRVMALLEQDKRFSGLTPRVFEVDGHPFGRLRVRLKKEIITIGCPEADPRVRVGEYVDPTEWNALISNPEVTVLDTRNTYEVSEGTFDGAIDPEIAHFSHFPKYVDQALSPSKHRKVAVFCTGGIRCEKATALLLERGFQEVYHLKGGILAYLQSVPESESLWNGKCFVFDERVLV